jgi:hypothetical protein
MALRGEASQVNLTSATTVAVTVSGIGIQLNDLILWGVVGGASGTDTFTPPSGWTVVPGFTKQSLNGGATAILYYKFATSTEVSASTLTMTVNQNDFHCATVAAFSGRNLSSPFTAVAQTAAVNSAAPPITFARSGVTSSAGDDVAVFDFVNALGVVSQVLTFTPPTGYADKDSPNPSAQFSQTICYCDSINVSAGSTGTLAGTLNNSQGSNANYGSVVISLASGGGAALGPSVVMLESSEYF